MNLNFTTVKNIVLPEGPVKKITSNGNTLWKAYDAEIEYIESTGTQYIRWEQIPFTRIRAILECSYLSATGTQDTMMSFFRNQIYLGSSGGVYSRIGIWNTSSVSSGSGTLLSGYNLGSVFTIEIRVTNSNIVARSNNNPEQSFLRVISENYIVLFCWANYNFKSKGRIYSFKLYDNTTPIMDLIPVRIGTTGYLYDKVQGKLYSNSGTGNFTLGPDLVVL